jgi:cytoskeletal protein CcmA (bactofilin family)
VGGAVQCCRQHVRKTRIMIDVQASEARANEAGLRLRERKASKNVLVFGPEVDIIGSVYVDGAVRLEGSIAGEIRCTALNLADTAAVRGRVVAETVTVYGTVAAGEIYANVLVLKPGCSVEAEIYHQHLQLDAGSYFDGKSRRVNDPIGMAPD